MTVVNSSRMNFKDTVDDILRNGYYPQVCEAVFEVVPQVAKEAAQKLRKTSPKGKTGKYAKGWTHQVEKGRVRVAATVYGKHGTYQLAHLLEHGHARRGGGRDTDAIEHIKPVEQWASDEAYERIMDKVEGIY